eukprot:scaffold2376_cov79-Phaeocystis_antarctica.AAC.3
MVLQSAARYCEAACALGGPFRCHCPASRWRLALRHTRSVCSWEWASAGSPHTSRQKWRRRSKSRGASASLER